MHESGMVRDLLGRAESAASGDVGSITGLRMRVGALSGVTPEGLRQCVDLLAPMLWGFAPELEIVESSDPADPQALGIVLESITVGE